MVFVGIVGIVIIFLFMFFYYCLLGFIVVIILLVYIYIIFQVFDWMNVVFMFLGIVVFILGVGMVVDVNIIIYEWIKEEFKLGKLVCFVFCLGNRWLFVMIFDVNVIMIIVVVVFFIFGISFVKGFVMMLILLILISFIIVVFLLRFFFVFFVESRWFDWKKGWFGVNKKYIMNIQDIDENIELYMLF